MYCTFKLKLPSRHNYQRSITKVPFLISHSSSPHNVLILFQSCVITIIWDAVIICAREQHNRVFRWRLRFICDEETWKKTSEKKYFTTGIIFCSLQWNQVKSNHMDSNNEFIIFSKLYPFLVVANKLFIEVISWKFCQLSFLDCNITVQTVKPGYMEEDCPITMFYENKWFPSLFGNKPIKFINLRHVSWKVK